MLSNGYLLVRQEQCGDLWREAEQSRLIQATELRPSRAWGLSLPLPGLRQGKLNFRAALKALLRPAHQTNQFSEIK